MRLTPSPLPTAVVVLTALAALGAPTLSHDRGATAEAAAVVRPHGLGYDTLGVRRGSTWALRGSLNTTGLTTAYREAGAGWLPAAGDFDGDGNDSVVLFRNGTWRLSNTPGITRTLVFGRAGDRPVVGDWNADGKDDLGVFRAGRWFLRTTPTTVKAFAFGRRGDLPVVGDWNGDGHTDIGVRRGTAFFLHDAPGPGSVSRSFRYGKAGDTPVSGDWNHDGQDEVGLFKNGVWFLRVPGTGTQSTVFGQRGDLPVVRRVASLAPGVAHRVVRRFGSVVQVVTVKLSAESTPDLVMGRNRLGGLERPTSMARRTGAVVAVNGDFFAPSGRPIHDFASDGALAQNKVIGGAAMALTRQGAVVRTAIPTVRVALTPAGQAPRSVQRWNRSGVRGNELAAYTAAGRALVRPPANACYAQLVPSSARFTRDSTGVLRVMKVLGTRCGGRAATVPTNGVLLAASGRGTGGAFLRGLRAGQSVTMDQLLGSAGSVSLLGANELLIAGGRLQEKYLVQPGQYSVGRQPRTATGVTADGRLVIVEVDGRQRGWSAGMTVRQLAILMRELGAVQAVNLDGGGSSVMVLNGVRITRPSDGFERSVSNGLVILPGNDPGQVNLRVGPLPVATLPGAPSQPSDPADDLQPIIPGLVPGIPGLSPRTRAVLAADGGSEPATRDGLAAAQDPGSTGGLAESQALSGGVLGDTLGLVLDLFQVR